MRHLIYLCFPRAKIIHTRRHPFDQALSMHTKIFQSADTFPYSTDMNEFAKHFVRYRKLMDMWSEVLPSDALLHVDYEELVQNFEEVSNSILRFSELSWEAEVRNFFNSRRAVYTASAQSVRKPVFNSSIARWKHFAATSWIQPLLSLLGEDRNFVSEEDVSFANTATILHVSRHATPPLPPQQNTISYFELAFALALALALASACVNLTQRVLRSRACRCGDIFWRFTKRGDCSPLLHVCPYPLHETQSYFFFF